MLQQILETMWVDPEILAELNDDQKQILFSKMRQEQLRKWKLREESNCHDEPDKKMYKSGKKSVTFLVDDNGEPLVVFIDDKYQTEMIDKDDTKAVIYCNIDDTYRYNTCYEESHRDVLHEITMNQSKSSRCRNTVAQKIALWEKKVMDEQSQITFCKINQVQVYDNTRDNFWNEDQCNNKTNANCPIAKSPKPKSKAALLEWYRLTEMPRQAGVANNRFETWFHGYVLRHEAESLLSDKVEGTFLVRLSESVWGYAITLRCRNGYKDYIIDVSKSNGNYKLLGSNGPYFMTLGSLINYYTNNSLSTLSNELLKFPCPTGKDNELQTVLLRPADNNRLIECQ